MTKLKTLIVLSGVIVLPGFACAEEVTTQVGGHDMTYVATPSAPAVQKISPQQAAAIASQAKPSKARVPIDPKAKAPTLK